MFCKSLVTFCLSIIIATGAFAQSKKPGLPRILPRDLEVELALSAAPKHLQKHAAVYVLGEEGYELAKEGTNDFTCFVERKWLSNPHWNDYISPQCFDEEGMQTIALAVFDKAKYYRQGLSNEEIFIKINAGFASGKYVAPRKPGAIYMLSPFNKVPDHRQGWKIFDYVPHIMYYAPNITNDDIGVPKSLHTGDPDYVYSGLPYLPILGPHGFIVQALGERERAQIIADYKEMIERLLEYVDFDFRDK